MADKIVCNPEVFLSRAYPERSRRTCFVIMPFRSETEADRRIQDVYNHHILPIAEKCGLDCTRADDRRYFRNGRPIMEQIWRAICTADIVIGEFTTANPNVTYEAGIAHTIGKPLIGLVQDMSDVPFDYRHLRFITYTTTHDGYVKLDDDLETEITEYIKELEDQYPQEYSTTSIGIPAEELLQKALREIKAINRGLRRVDETNRLHRTDAINREGQIISEAKNELFFCSNSLSNLMPYRSPLLAASDEGTYIRLLAMNLDDEMVFKQSTSTFGRFPSMHSLNFLSLFTSKPNIEIRTINFPLTIHISARDVRTDTGYMRVKFPGYGTSGHDSPCVELVPADRECYSFYKNQIERLWEQGIPWEA